MVYIGTSESQCVKKLDQYSIYTLLPVNTYFKAIINDLPVLLITGIPTRPQL